MSGLWISIQAEMGCTYLMRPGSPDIENDRKYIACMVWYCFEINENNLKPILNKMKKTHKTSRHQNGRRIIGIVML